jgi:hypothetical protein
MRPNTVNLKGRVRTREAEQGVALLISIFVLMLVSVVAIAMVVSTGTESSLAGNYRSSTGVYYAAMAGLEEARGRLWASDPNALQITDPGLLPACGVPMPVGCPVYILNPLAGEVVAPWDPTSSYPDSEFSSEFTTAVPNPSPAAVSIWQRAPLNALPVPGPLFKWVRINAVSEKSLNLSIGPLGTPPSTGPLFYSLTLSQFTNDPTAGPQVFEVTALAALPNGSNGSGTNASQKIAQYLVVASAAAPLTFPSALTLDGPVDHFSSSFNSDFYVSGSDRARAASDQPNGTPCATVSPVPAIGVLGDDSVNHIKNGIPPITMPPYNRYANYYSSVTPTPPSIAPVSPVSAFQTVSGLESLVQKITNAADQPPIPGPATTLPSFGSASAPVTTVVSGDLTLSGTQTGYGLLVVRGGLMLGGNVTWHGVILVIGEGSININSYGYGKIDGALLVAKTRNEDGDLRYSLGDANFSVSDPNYGNNGIYYNSCWVSAATQNLTTGAKVLSFHEISQ